MSTEGPGRAICPDGMPADLIVEEDGTTWLRADGFGFNNWANLDKLREPPVPAGYRVRVDPLPADTNLHTLRADYMVAGAVRATGFNWGRVM